MKHPGTRQLRRIRETCIACAAVLLIACVFAPAPAGPESADPELKTLEDLFGDTGNSFQAALGLLNLEGQSGNPAGRGFGLAVDDMFVEWFEITEVPDVTQCANGQCAVLEVPSSVLYEGVASIPVSLLDASPYAHACVGGAGDGRVCYPANGSGGNPDCPSGLCAQAANDCDLDGFFDGPADDGDCNDNGTPDVVVLVTSEVDFGEVIVLDRVSPATSEYRGQLAISVLADSDGVLHLVQIGEEIPTVVLTYLDHDDGTGQVCQNDVVPESRGRVQTAVTVNIQTCDVVVVGTSFTDNGDSDHFPDSSETIDLSFSVQNNCGFLLTDCVARLSTNSPEVECIKKGAVPLGDLPGSSSGVGPVIQSPEAFIFKMDDTLADRSSLGLTPDDALSASFNVAISCTEIDGLTFPQNFSMALDININDAGQTSTEWREDFEAGGTNPADPLQGTAFYAQNLDRGLPGHNNAEGLIYSVGWRCQYADPNWVNSNSYNDAEGQICYPAMNLWHANAVFWQVDGSLVAGTPDGGRAYRGEKSMYYGVFLGDPQENFTTPLSTVESAATEDLINLGVWYPQLSFWHQVSLGDHRSVSTRPRRNVDRGVVQILLHDSAGTRISDWMNLQPLQNAYAQQAEDNFFNCTFDPVDDGNTEHDFFDPTDPDRRLGPSSTCFPTFSWAWQGSTTGPFFPDVIGHATTPPASTDVPSLGLGTWVETKVDLSEFRGRRVKLRYLVTSLKATAETWVGMFGTDRDENDDGWWIDEIVITEALGDPATFDNDDFTLGTCSVSGAACINQCKFSLIGCTNDSQCGVDEPCLRPCPVGQSCLPVPPDCGPVCTSVTASAFVTPDEVLNPGTVSTPVPGHALTINGAAPSDPITGALPSTADACLDGNLQYRFCRDGDPLGDGPAVPDADCDDPRDLLLRGWTENSVLTIAPQASAGYTMEVRCSQAHDCKDTELVQVDVSCPGAVNALGLKALRWADKGRLEWSGAPLVVDYWTSVEFSNTQGLPDYPGTGFNAVGPVNFLDLGSLSPSSGTVVGVLVKADGELNTIPIGFYCNSVTWRSGGASEIPESGYPASPGRDSSIGSVP